jgi:hypothetical protein
MNKELELYKEAHINCLKRALDLIKKLEDENKKLKNENKLLKGLKQTIDYTKLIKEGK